MSVSLSSVPEGSITQEVLLVSLPSAPAQMLTVSLVTSDSNSLVYPSEFYFTNNSQLSVPITFIAGAAGSVVVTARLRGVYASAFRIVYPAGSIVYVRGELDDPPSPKLQAASFSGDGSSVLLSFTSATNRAGHVEYS